MSDQDVENIINKYTELAKSKNLDGKDILAGLKELTDSVGDNIRKGYDAINEAIEALDSKDPDMGQKKNDLQLLKREVPKKFAITKEQMKILRDTLNAIVGVNRSDIKG